MSSNFQKASSQIFLTLFIGVIVISFMFSGPFLDSGTPDSVGSVGKHDIKFREFNMEVERQSQFYSRFMNGGKPLTSKQLRQFKIYDNAIRSLAQNKLRFIMADELGIVVSNDEIIKNIKEAPYFKTGDQFDVNRYKQLLAANSITPEDFEKDTTNQIKAQKLQSIVTSVPISTNLEKDLNKLFNERKTVKTITLNSAELKKTIPVTKKEITDFLAKEVNLARTKSLFEQRKAGLSQKPQVKARHILFKTDKDEGKAYTKASELRKRLTKANFSKLAKKHTDEEVGKKSGGNLNWVSKGQMVEPFEKKLFAMKKGEISQPVKTRFGYHIIFAEDIKEAKEAKFNDHKNEIAKETIQKDRDVKELLAKATEEVKSALESGKSIKKLTSKYRLTVSDSTDINRLEGDKSTLSLTEEQLNKIFTEDKRLHTFSEALKTSFIQVEGSKTATEKFDLTSTKNIIAQKVTQDLLKKLGETYKYRQNSAAQLPN